MSTHVIGYSPTWNTVALDEGKKWTMTRLEQYSTLMATNTWKMNLNMILSSNVVRKPTTAHKHVTCGQDADSRLLAGAGAIGPEGDAIPAHLVVGAESLTDGGIRHPASMASTGGRTVQLVPDVLKGDPSLLAVALPHREHGCVDHLGSGAVLRHGMHGTRIGRLGGRRALVCHLLRDGDHLSGVGGLGCDVGLSSHHQHHHAITSSQGLQNARQCVLHLTVSLLRASVP